MQKQAFSSVVSVLVCLGLSIPLAWGASDFQTYSYREALSSIPGDEGPSAAVIEAGSCQTLSKSFTLDAVSASQITKLRLEASLPNFMDLELLDASKSGNTFFHDYRICVEAGAPGGTYNVEMTFIFMDALDNEVTRRNHTEVVIVPCDTPNTPVSLSAVAISGSQINLSWQDASSNESGFRIERSLFPSSGFSQVGAVDANVTSYEDTGLAAGTYYYRVRAYNSCGNSGYSNTAFAVVPPPNGDDHGDSCSEATNVSLNSTHVGRINHAGDLDYFRLSVPTSGELRAYSSGSTDTYGTLHSMMCTSIEEDDDSGAGLNFRIVAQVNPGTYFVSVRHLSAAGTGNYTLQIEFSSADSIVYPQLALGGGYEVALFLSNATTTNWNGTVYLNKGDDQDWDSTWSLNGIDRTGLSAFSVYLGPNATQKFLLTSKADVKVGYLRITGNDGAQVSNLSTSFFYDVTEKGEVTDSIGIPRGVPGRRFICAVEKNDDALTGFAWAPASLPSGFPVQLALYDSEGNLIRSVTVTFEGHTALFFHEVFDNFPENFVGKVVVNSEEEIHLTALRLCWTQDGFQLTSVPPSVE